MSDIDTMVIVLDGVLVNTEVYAYSKFRSNWDIYGEIFKDVGVLKEEKILDRTEKYLDKWLLKDELKELYDKDDEVKEELSRVMFNTIYSENMYDDLVPTSIGRKILMGGFIENKKIKNIHIIDQCVNEQDRMNKMEFISKYFDNDKINVTIIPNSDSISDYLSKISWRIFVCDDLDIIYDIVKNPNLELENKEFLIPEKGYNRDIDPVVFALIALSGGSIVHYGDTKSSNII